MIIPCVDQINICIIHTYYPETYAFECIGIYVYKLETKSMSVIKAMGILEQKHHRSLKGGDSLWRHSFSSMHHLLICLQT